MSYINRVYALEHVKEYMGDFNGRGDLNGFREGGKFENHLPIHLQNFSWLQNFVIMIV